jgi:tryptophan synthase beta chain
MLDTHSVAAGLDYVGVSPIIAYLAETGKIQVTGATDAEVIAAHRVMMAKEGIIGALESTHAVAAALRDARQLTLEPGREVNILINLSGRGDKDIFTIAEAFEDPSWQRFLEHKVAKDRLKKEKKSKNQS